MGSAKDKHGVRERFAKENCLFTKNGHLQIQEFRSTTICITHMQITVSIKVLLWFLFLSRSVSRSGPSIRRNSASRRSRGGPTRRDPDVAPGAPRGAGTRRRVADRYQ